jgi:hypothetical protein
MTSRGQSDVDQHAECGAEMRAGELLAEMEKNKGARSQSHPKTGGSKKLPPVKDSTPKLTDLGISKSQSSRWQRLASLMASPST